MKRILASVVIAADMASPAVAEGLENWYVGAGTLESEVEAPIVTLEDSGFALTLGYSFEVIEGLDTAAEYTYTRVMKFDAKDNTVNKSADINTMDLSLVVGKELQFVAPFVRLGFSRIDADVFLTGNGASLRSDGDSNALIWGVGLDVPFQKSASVRFEYTAAEYDKTDLSSLRLGLITHF